ncbi:hypothetical protein ACLOJK_026467 [Asimina triloba]
MAEIVAVFEVETLLPIRRLPKRIGGGSFAVATHRLRACCCWRIATGLPVAMLMTVEMGRRTCHGLKIAVGVPTRKRCCYPVTRFFRNYSKWVFCLSDCVTHRCSTSIDWAMAALADFGVLPLPPTGIGDGVMIGRRLGGPHRCRWPRRRCCCPRPAVVRVAAWSCLSGIDLIGDEQGMLLSWLPLMVEKVPNYRFEEGDAMVESPSLIWLTARRICCWKILEREKMMRLPWWVQAASFYGCCRWRRGRPIAVLLNGSDLPI